MKTVETRHVFGAILVAAALTLSCHFGSPGPQANEAPEPALAPPAGAKPFDPGRRAPKLDLTLEEKVGQLFVVSGNGVYLHEAAPAYKTLRHHVVDNHVGGVIWFRSNVYETAILAGELQKLAKVPLLFSADLEAGTGQRFEDVIWGSPAMALAATGDLALTERRARATGEEARAIGIGQIYAPVADVNVNPSNPVINVRSFGEDPVQVGRFVAAYVRGLQEGGVLATIKHFPGHGDTAVDSHRSLPVIRAERTRLEAVELAPFREGLKAGAASVMVAHLAVPALDASPAPPLVHAAHNAVFTRDVGEVEKSGTLPASLSPRVVHGLLRTDLAFSGLVVTDAMTMGALAAHFDAGEAAIRAILAGNDMVLLSADTDVAIRAVVAAVKSGRVPQGRVDESVDRVLHAKAALALFQERTPPLSRIVKTVGSPEHEALEAEVARRSMTLLREEAGVLPLNGKKRILSLVVLDETLITPAALKGVGVALRSELDARTLLDGEPTVRHVRIDQRATPEEIENAVLEARTADVVVLSLFVPPRSGAGRIDLPASARTLVPALLATGKPVVAVSFGNPYLLKDLPALRTYLCAYGIHEVIQTAAVAALFGEADIGGQLPVTIPGIAERGAGIARAASRSHGR